MSQNNNKPNKPTWSRIIILAMAVLMILGAISIPFLK